MLLVIVGFNSPSAHDCYVVLQVRSSHFHVQRVERMLETRNSDRIRDEFPFASGSTSRLKTSPVARGLEYSVRCERSCFNNLPSCRSLSVRDPPRLPLVIASSSELASARGRFHRRRLRVRDLLSPQLLPRVQSRLQAGA